MAANKPEESSPVGRGELLPVLPLRDIVVFPHMIVPLFVGREKSVRALEAVMRDDKQILLVAQKNAAQDDPGVDDLYKIGTVSTVLQLLKLPDGTVKVLVEGGKRAKIDAYKSTDPYFEAFAGRWPRRSRPRAASRRRWRAASSRSSRATSSSTRRSRRRCWSRSTRSTIRPSSPTRSRRT
jgi:ATP-dependent Lon protease